MKNHIQAAREMGVGRRKGRGRKRREMREEEKEER